MNVSNKRHVVVGQASDDVDGDRVRGHRIRRGRVLQEDGSARVAWELEGAKIGEKRTFTLTAEEAYGPREEAALMKIPRSEFAQLEEEAKLAIGMTLVAQMEQGPAPFNITELTDDEVTADFNHKLAGEALTFAVEIIELRDASVEELSHGHVHGPEGHDH